MVRGRRPRRASCARRAGPGGPARTRASAPHKDQSVRRTTLVARKRVRHNEAANNRIAVARVTLRRGESSGAELKCCYEAGPTGYVLYWQLTRLGVTCEVIAPSLIPSKAGDRGETDRRGAERLGR